MPDFLMAAQDVSVLSSTEYTIDFTGADGGLGAVSERRVSGGLVGT